MSDDPSSEQAATRIAQALRFQTVEARDYLIIWGDRDRNYYVQFPSPQRPGPSGLPPSLHSEAVSDLYLTPENALGKQGAKCLLGLGWDAPTSAQALRRYVVGGETANWHREFGLPGDEAFRSIADVVLKTLSNAYGYSGGSLELDIAP